MEESLVNKTEDSKNSNDIYMHPVELGDKDKAGNIVSRIFGQSVGNYIVYKANSRIKLSSQTKFYQLCTTVSPLMTLIKRVTRDLPTQEERAKEVRANAMLHACQGEIETAKLILNNYYEYIIRLKNRKAQIQYLFGSFVLTALTLLIAGLLFYLGSPITQDFNTQSQFISGISMAVMGGFLSILLNLKKLEIDNESGWEMNAFGGASRIMISVIAGIAMLVLIKADILFGFVNKSELSESFYGLLTLCFLSGFSEGLIPNVLRKIEGSVVSSDK